MCLYVLYKTCAVVNKGLMGQPKQIYKTNMLKILNSANQCKQFAFHVNLFMDRSITLGIRTAIISEMLV